MLSPGRTIQRTPPWVELVNDKTTTDKQNYILQPFSSIYQSRTKQITGNFERVIPSDKPAKCKTRGVAGEQHEQALLRDISVVEQSKLFKVDKRTCKGFKALFHSSFNSDILGEVPWPDFLHAMNSIGFSMEKLQGSAWNFTPPNVFDVGQSIQFHEPHPASKIPLI